MGARVCDGGGLCDGGPGRSPLLRRPLKGRIKQLHVPVCPYTCTCACAHTRIQFYFWMETETLKTPIHFLVGLSVYPDLKTVSDLGSWPPWSVGVDQRQTSNSRQGVTGVPAAPGGVRRTNSRSHCRSVAGGGGELVP